ncbi:MAG: bifunctional glutamate N-acetyltransferase/amino-acid acetyltransferase ArgJ [Deltaproteobacteria bacterium]|nr:bifunctional glutamate N-acetyltransferase/amino-acid acetyltransferase ArgJ [Deltaproteobacteria bacterium]
MENLICPGFMAAGVASGLKKAGEKDLAIIFSKIPAKVAGVFTSNKIKAAPVLLDMERIKSGIGQALIVNSGNANCCTGDKGLDDAKTMARFAASGLGIPEDRVLVCSTGVIGEPLPIDKIRRAIPGLIDSLRPEGFYDLARAIMTTDTAPKSVSRQGKIDGKTFTVIGVTKGSGMICPDMATMLCFICTDIDADHGLLKNFLNKAARQSFNRITIDGDTSTNDTVIIMANGFSGAVVKSSEHMDYFQNLDVLIDLAKQIVRDGEGATKFVEIYVKGALSDNDAHEIANTVANSNLVKTALFGEDANWGRIIAAAGRAKVPLDQGKINIFFDDVLMVKNGMGCGKAVEAEATKVLMKPELSISIDLNMGSGCASVFTCDFSVEYVKINADYRS